VSTRQQVKVICSQVLRKWPFATFSSRVAHLVGSASLHNLYEQSRLSTTSPAEAIELLTGSSVDYASEFRDVRDRDAARAAATTARHPDYYAIEQSTALLLYALVRHAKPSLVIEVGVADGRSTQVILSALDANQHGRLVSLDVVEGVGAVVAGHPRWSLWIREQGRRANRHFDELLTRAGAPDLFFHDGSHHYGAQYVDYQLAWQHMNTGGIFVSDDVDYSYAFIDFVRSCHVAPVVLMERRKAIGVLLKP